MTWSQRKKSHPREIIVFVSEEVNYIEYLHGYIYKKNTVMKMETSYF